MRGSFFTFRVANSGMHTARANLNVTSHNVANMGIPGFSRQVTVQSANPAINLRNGRGMFGTGSSVQNVKQMRDQFIDRRFRSQNAVFGDHAVKVPQLSLIQTMFNELSDGVLASFNGFFSRIQELTGNTHDSTFRLNVINAGDTLANMIRSNATALQNQQRDINGEVRAVVTEINSLGQQISILNKQIRSFEFDGAFANDLRDERNLLLDRLSEFVNITVEERDVSATSGIDNDRRLAVSINGYDFINHDRVQRLELVPRPIGQERNEMDVHGLYDIRFANGAHFNIFSPHLQGTLKGLIDVRDGNGNWRTASPGQVGVPGELGTPGEYYPGAGLPAVQPFLNTIAAANTRIDQLQAEFDLLGPTSPPEDFQRLGSELFMAVAERNLAAQNLENVISAMDARDGTAVLAAIAPIPTIIDAIIENINDGHMSIDADEIRNYITAAFAAAENTNDEYDDLIDRVMNELPAAGEASTVTIPSSLPERPIAARDALPGDTTNFRGIPFYQNRLNEMVRVFVRAVNEGHDSQGRPIEGNPGHRNGYGADGQSNRNFFIWTDRGGNLLDDGTFANDDFRLLNSLNFNVNPLLLREPSLLGTDTDPTRGESANDVILGFLNINTSQSLFREGRLEDYIIATTGFLAIDIRASQRFRLSYHERLIATQNQRAAISDVDMNEELLNMTRFSQLYQVNARMISTMNSVYDTLINRLGVG